MCVACWRYKMRKKQYKNNKNTHFTLRVIVVTIKERKYNSRLGGCHDASSEAVVAGSLLVTGRFRLRLLAHVFRLHWPFSAPVAEMGVMFLLWMWDVLTQDSDKIRPKSGQKFKCRALTWTFELWNMSSKNPTRTAYNADDTITYHLLDPTCRGWLFPLPYSPFWHSSHMDFGKAILHLRLNRGIASGKQLRSFSFV